MTKVDLAKSIREFTDPKRHDELVAHGWQPHKGIWQPQYACPITGVRLIQSSAWDAHIAMKKYVLDRNDRLAQVEQPQEQQLPDDYVAWLRYVRNGNVSHIQVCDSDSKGAFMVYRYPRRQPQSGDARNQFISAALDKFPPCREEWTPTEKGVWMSDFIRFLDAFTRQPSTPVEPKQQLPGEDPEDQPCQCSACVALREKL